MLSVATLVMPAGVQGVVVNYGNSPNVPPGFAFLGVTESSGTDPVPLYGPPDYLVGGVDFDPVGFSSSATGGASDITDGQLNFTLAGLVTGQQIGVIDLIGVSERGEFTLVGMGTSATSAFAVAAMRVTVTAIDGVAVSPILLSPIDVAIGPNLLSNPGLLRPWSLGLGIDIDSQLVTRGIPFVGGATKIEVVIDNSLVSISEPGTVAFIAKKDFQIDFVSSFVPVVPEPATLALACLSLSGLAMVRRRQT
jgi:hypothetical protein